MRKYSWDLIIDISNSVEYYTPENHSYISMLFIFLWNDTWTKDDYDKR